jgi:S-formylglutathione hydrolase FrmB
VLLYLPPGYDNDHGRFPVVEMLHGDLGRPDDMIGLLNLDQPTAMPAGGRFIAVAPDGHGPVISEGSFADTSRQRLGTAVSQDLQAWVDTYYRTTRQWTVMGLSDGGFGAAYLGFRYRGAYRSVCAMSGSFEARGPAFAGQPASAQSADSPLSHVSSDGPPTLLVVGASDPAYLHEAARYAAAMADVGQAHQLVVVPGGHDWDLWQAQTPRCLTFLLQQGSLIRGSPNGR